MELISPRERYGVTAGEWDDTPLQCVACGGWFDPDDTVFKPTRRGPVCGHCAENGEAD